MRGLLIIITAIIVFFIVGWVGHFFYIPIVLTLALIMWFCISTRNTAKVKARKSGKSDFEKKRLSVRQSIPADMGALIDHPDATSIVGYYKEGVVFTKNKMPIGTYRKDIGDAYQFYYNDMDHTNKNHDVRIGWYSDKSHGGGMIFVYENVHSGVAPELIAEQHDKWIHPKDDYGYKAVELSNLNDTIGACAAYAILRHACNELNDNELLKHFLKQ